MDVLYQLFNTSISKVFKIEVSDPILTSKWWVPHLSGIHFFNYISFMFCYFGALFVVVEDIYRQRQPLPTMDAIYFLQPTREK
jgi:hypothetical protein